MHPDSVVKARNEQVNSHEVAVRDFTSAVLRKKDHQVVQASDGQEALAACGSAPSAIGAAIVDIIMPNMSANDFLPSLKAQQPGMRILLTSGYSEAEARWLCAAYPGAAFIQKPDTAPQLARAVDRKGCMNHPVLPRPLPLALDSIAIISAQLIRARRIWRVSARGSAVCIPTS